MGLFSIIARLTMDTAGFDAGARKAESRATQLGAKVGAAVRNQLAAVFSVGAITQITRHTLDYVGKMQDAADATDETVEEIQKLDYAAKKGGSSLGALLAGLQQLGKVRAAILAGKGSQEAGILEGMGISREMLQTQSLSQTMRQVADFLRSNNLGADRGAIVQKLFGQSGEQLIPVFLNGITEMGNELERIGAVMDSNLIRKLDEAGDAFDRAKAKARTFFGEAVGGAFEVGKEMKARVLAGRINLADEANGGNLTYEQALEIARTQIQLQENEGNLLRTGLPGSRGRGGGGSVFDVAMRTSAVNLQQGSLAAIGGFVGLGGTRDTQVEVMKKILKATQETAENTRDLEKDPEP